MTSYRKKPVVIQAVRWTGSNLSQVQRFVGAQGEDEYDLYGFARLPDGASDPFTAEVYDKLHDTWVQCKDGDWIIRGIQNEFYPCDNEVFVKTYDEVTPREAI